MGFRENPENINRSGRPKKQFCLTDILREALDENYNEEGRTKKKALIDKLLELAIVDGDVQMIKYAMDRIDGKPLQQIEQDTTERHITVSRESIDADND